MTEIKILIEGYAKKIENGWKASSSVVLVKNNKNARGWVWFSPGWWLERLRDSPSANTGTRIAV